MIVEAAAQENLSSSELRIIFAQIEDNEIEGRGKKNSKLETCPLRMRGLVDLNNRQVTLVIFD